MADNIWVAKENQFCVRYTLEDLSGFFRSQLTISPGTKAYIWADGQPYGEVPAGVYTLESFTEKLAFWRSAKIVDAILVREESLRLKLSVADLPTTDQVFVRAEVLVTVELADLGMFIKNFLGSRHEITKDMLLHWILPIAQQAVREAVRKLTIAELASGDVRLMMQAALGECSRLTLARYGLRLNEVHAVGIYNEEYDAQMKKVGEACLMRVELDADNKLSEVRDAEAFAKIERLEREQELDILAKNVKLDREEADIELQLRQCDIRKMMREAVLSDRFDQVNNAEEFAKFMEEVDKQKLLREDETEALKQVYRDKGANREQLAHVLALNRQAELDTLQAEIEHAGKLQALKNEAELAQVAKSAENDQVLEALEASISAEYLRFEDDMQKLRSRIALDAEKSDAELADRRKRQAFERDVQADNLRTLAEMQEMKAKARREKMELAKELKQQELEHDLQRMEARRGMTPAELAATADPENAKYVAEMEAARYNAEHQQQRVEDMQKMTDKTLETIQGITGQAFGAVAGGNFAAGTPRVIVCAACRAENAQGTKFCSNCGKQL